MLLALALATVPLTLGYLGPERYGLWVTISSAVALLGFTDLGVANGLLTAVTRSLADQDLDGARRQISSAIGLLIGVVATVALAFVVMEPFIPWDRLGAVHSQLAISEAGPGVTVAALCYLAGQPIAVASQVRFARQEGWLVHITAALGNIASVVALLLVIALKGGLPLLALAMGLPPVLASLVNAWVLYGRDAPELAPDFRLADRSTGVKLLRAGFLFLILQLAITVAFSSDAIVVAQIVGAEAVAAYGVTSRLFMIPLGLVSLGLAPLWPAYTEAIARKDLTWVRETLRRSTITAVAVTGIGSGVLIFAAQSLIGVWVDGRVNPPFALIAGFAVWIVLSSAGNSVAMFLNGAGELRLQATAAVMMATANLGLSIVLTSRFGVAGVVWGTVFSYTALTLLPMAIYVPRITERLAEHVDP